MTWNTRQPQHQHQHQHHNEGGQRWEGLLPALHIYTTLQIQAKSLRVVFNMLMCKGTIADLWGRHEEKQGGADITLLRNIPHLSQHAGSSHLHM